MAGFTIKPTRQLLQERGLLEGGKVQKFIDSECIRHMDKYTPFQTGFLKRSVILGTVIGSGILRYVASYSRSVYYNNAGRGVEGTARGGRRGRRWFEVMKTFHLSEIIEGAKRIAGAVKAQKRR